MSARKHDRDDEPPEDSEDSSKHLKTEHDVFYQVCVTLYLFSQ